MRNGEIKAENHVLRSPKVYGGIGNFLVMEFIGHYKPPEIYEVIVAELRKNFIKLKNKGLISKTPQDYHFMCVGNTNPRNPKKGKFVVFLPYDYA